MIQRAAEKLLENKKHQKQKFVEITEPFDAVNCLEFERKVQEVQLQ